MKKVRATLTGMEGVEKVEVNFAKKIATVTAKSDAKIDEKAVKTALKKTGYGVTSYEVKAAAKPSEYLVTVSGMT